MKFKIEKVATGNVRLTLWYAGGMPPVVIEGGQLDSVMTLVEQAKRAAHFEFSMEVK